MLRRFLAVGTFWKILLANALVVAGAVALVPDAVHVLRPDFSALAVLAPVLVLTLVANAIVLRLALAPLTELERAAQRVAEGDLRARARLSPLADRPLTALTRTFNRMVESVEAQREQGREVASRALTDAEQAKRRLSHDLREESAQALASTLIRLRAAAGMRDDAARARMLDEVRADIGAVIEQLRAFAGQLRPPSLELLGVDRVIEAYACSATRGTAIRVDVRRDPLRGVLEPEVELQLLRVVQDLIDRAVASADRLLRVDVRRSGDRVIAAVRHDGSADPPGGGAPSLFAIRERASYFGGTLDVSVDGSETTVRVQVPLIRAA